MANVRVTDAKVSDIADSIRQKKNESTQYTLEEMKSEIDSLSSLQGKTVKFVNLDESGSQSIVAYRYYTVKNDYRESGSTLEITEDPEQYLAFYLSSNHTNYILGSLDTTSPIKFSEIEDGITITASPGYLYASGDRQLVDMSNYCGNNNFYNDDRSAFSNTAIEYFKSVKPTSLNKAFIDVHLDYSSGLYFLDTSECTDFGEAFSSFNSPILNLSTFDVSKGESFYKCFSYAGDNDVVIDISNWKFKENALLQRLFYRAEVAHIEMNNVDVSKINSFKEVFYMLGDSRVTIEVLDLKSWHNNIVTTMDSFTTSARIKIINMPNIDTSNVTDFDYAFYDNLYLQEIRGVIDMKSAETYKRMIENSVRNLTAKIKIKNPPSDENWWQTAGFTSEDQFEIVT